MAVSTGMGIFITAHIMAMLITHISFTVFGTSFFSLLCLFQFAVPLTATVWFWIKFQATPGKMATSLRVVDAKTGKPLSIGQAVGRYFAYIVSLLPLGLGIFWIVFDKRKQGWHDKLAGSVVVRSHAKEAVVFED